MQKNKTLCLKVHSRTENALPAVISHAKSGNFFAPLYIINNNTLHIIFISNDLVMDVSDIHKFFDTFEIMQNYENTLKTIFFHENCFTCNVIEDILLQR